MLKTIKRLYRYTEWANAEYFSAAGALSASQFVQHIPSSFPSVSATLSHMVRAEWGWLRRWLGESPTAWSTMPRTIADNWPRCSGSSAWRRRERTWTIFSGHPVDSGSENPGAPDSKGRV